MKAISTDPGAYVLLVTLDAPLCVDIPAYSGVTLPAGTYAYCGSAYGPGGLAARVRRHLRRAKPAHWHIDRLTARGRIVAAGVRPGACECDFTDLLLARGATVPLPGFGSSDCRRCPAHLLAVPGDFDLAGLGLDTVSPAPL